MINRQGNIAFKLVALFFAVTFINIGISPEQPEKETGVSDVQVCDTICDTQESANFFTQVLEVGWDIYQAIPDAETSQKEEKNSKKSYTDWFYNDTLCLVTSVSDNSLLNKPLFPNIDYRNYIIEVIPPPPKA
ncbi:hypothetical protein JMN32_08440 [Fulvivirga sp. 29W222]|uniref:Uncharacterized protein n=1 Tax=Fulvivirga marina TaxID=2494733 RepID=A0A937FXH3_9BACT|nr:hypothetical protein [Fulvivirga marina]MBL6446333.1 hypothetical protein [Fulvivirga marina]